MADEKSMAGFELKVNIKVPFFSEKEANIAYEVLRVDKEPPRSQVSKSLNVEENILYACLSAPTCHQLRTGVNGFFDSLLLVCETLISFGPPVCCQYMYNY